MDKGVAVDVYGGGGEGVDCWLGGRRRWRRRELLSCGGRVRRLRS